MRLAALILAISFLTACGGRPEVTVDTPPAGDWSLPPCLCDYDPEIPTGWGVPPDVNDEGNVIGGTLQPVKGEIE